MNKFVSWTAFAIAVAALVLIADRAEARGGGARGGGPRAAGGFNGRERGEIGNRSELSERGVNGEHAQNVGTRAQDAKSNIDAKAATAKSNFSGKNQPFTAGWYANHPQAWRYSHPHADAWAVATFGTAAAWLGLTGDAAEPVETETVYTADAGDDSQEAMDEESEDEPGDETAPSDDKAASDLAKRGQIDVKSSDDFLPLGVFSLSPEDHENATAVVQLAVNKDGIIRGNYYDALSDNEQIVRGAVDKQTQRVAFTVGKEGTIVFETLLPNLTKQNGWVTLFYNDGATSEWTLERQENRTAAK